MVSIILEICCEDKEKRVRPFSSIKIQWPNYLVQPVHLHITEKKPFSNQSHGSKGYKGDSSDFEGCMVVGARVLMEYIWVFQKLLIEMIKVAMKQGRSKSSTNKMYQVK